MDTSTVTLSAPVTCTVPSALVTLPPDTTARARARNLTLPVTPSWSVEIPSMAAVASSGLDAVVRWGLSKLAEKVIEPGLSAVRDMAITWSGALANTSRRYRTPPIRYDTDV